MNIVFRCERCCTTKCPANYGRYGLVKWRLELLANRGIFLSENRLDAIELLVREPYDTHLLYLLLEGECPKLIDCERPSSPGHCLVPYNSSYSSSYSSSDSE